MIRKFIGLWLKEMDLLRWIKATWNPRGQNDLQLGENIFFTVFFFNEEDRDIILQGGLYLFYSVGIYLHPWKERFNLGNEEMSISKFWIEMYSLPCE